MYIKSRHLHLVVKCWCFAERRNPVSPYISNGAAVRIVIKPISKYMARYLLGNFQ